MGLILDFFFKSEMIYDNYVANIIDCLGIFFGRLVAGFTDWGRGLAEQ